MTNRRACLSSMSFANKKVFNIDFNGRSEMSRKILTNKVRCFNAFEV